MSLICVTVRFYCVRRRLSPPSTEAKEETELLRVADLSDLQNCSSASQFLRQKLIYYNLREQSHNPISPEGVILNPRILFHQWNRTQRQFSSNRQQSPMCQIISRYYPVNKQSAMIRYPNSNPSLQPPTLISPAATSLEPYGLTHDNHTPSKILQKPSMRLTFSPSSTRSPRSKREPHHPLTESLSNHPPTETKNIEHALSFRKHSPVCQLIGQSKPGSVFELQKQQKQIKEGDIVGQQQKGLSKEVEQIWRLREVIEGLSKENRKLKNVVCELMEDRPQEEGALRDAWSTHSSFRNSNLHSFTEVQLDQKHQCQTQPQPSKRENMILNEEISLLKRTVKVINSSKVSALQENQRLLHENQRLLQEMHRCHEKIQELTTLNTQLRSSYECCYDRIKELEHTIYQLEELQQPSLNNSHFTIRSYELETSGNESLVSVVEHRVSNTGSVEELAKLGMILGSEAGGSKERMSGSEVSKDQSIKTKSSQNAGVGPSRLERRV